MNLSKGREVIIFVENKIQHEGEETVIASEEQGLYYQKGDSNYLLYKEEATPTAHQVVLKFLKDGSVILNRTGQNQAKFCFDINKVTKTVYQTQAGQAELLVKTKELIFEKQGEPDTTTCFIQYDLIHGETLLGNYFLTISFFAKN